MVMRTVAQGGNLFDGFADGDAVGTKEGGFIVIVGASVGVDEGCAEMVGLLVGETVGDMDVVGIGVATTNVDIGKAEMILIFKS